MRDYCAPTLGTDATTPDSCLLADATACACPPCSDAPALSGNGASLKDTRATQERAFIQSVLQQSNNCRSLAAQILGISRATLYNKMKKYGIAKANE